MAAPNTQVRSTRLRNSVPVPMSRFIPTATEAGTSLHRPLRRPGARYAVGLPGSVRLG